jgi:excisionase family DNA binding protein
VSANDNRPVLTVSEIADRWRCHRQSVLDKIHRGDLYAFKIGRAHRVALAEIERYERGMAA